MVKKKDTNLSKPLVEGLDYYLEKGNWVFTEHFLLKRGYCCGSGCRHCPYPVKTPPQNRNTE
jgi:primosomal protein N'